MGITHWDDHEPFRNERGQMAASWTNLGSPAGSYRCGLTRIQMGAGEQPTPPHVHGEAEEIFYVLSGSGLAYMGLDDDEKAYEVGEGDCLVFKNFHEAHTLRGGDGGLDVLAFGAREYLPTGALPRAGVAWNIVGWIHVHTDGHPWDREPPLEWPAPEPERVSTIVNVAAVEPEVRGGRKRRDLARAAGSRWTGLKHIELDAGTLSGPPHVHTMEEEIFVVLAGEGRLELTPSPRNVERLEEPQIHQVRAGSVVARPPGTGIAHAFRAGDQGMTLLAWGTRVPGDVTYYPRSNKVNFQGLGIIGRVEPVDYWEGEELD